MWARCCSLNTKLTFMPAEAATFALCWPHALLAAISRSLSVNHRQHATIRTAPRGLRGDAAAFCPDAGDVLRAAEYRDVGERIRGDRDDIGVVPGFQPAGLGRLRAKSQRGGG